jgi:hypothetical protein
MALHENWFEYEEQVLVPFISNGPLIFWLYALFGIREATASSWMGLRCDTTPNNCW